MIKLLSAKYKLEFSPVQCQPAFSENNKLDFLMIVICWAVLKYKWNTFHLGPYLHLFIYMGICFPLHKCMSICI